MSHVWHVIARGARSVQSIGGNLLQRDRHSCSCAGLLDIGQLCEHRSFRYLSCAVHAKANAQHMCQHLYMRHSCDV